MWRALVGWRREEGVLTLSPVNGARWPASAREVDGMAFRWSSGDGEPTTGRGTSWCSLWRGRHGWVRHGATRRGGRRSGTPARSKTDGAVDFLCEKTGKRSEKRRRNVGSRQDQKSEARAHRVAGGELLTAAVTTISGEESLEREGAVEGEKWGR